MKRSALIVFFSALLFLHVQAQKEYNVWCFGDSCGIDFSTGSPVSFPGVVMSQFEGCSSIADSAGNLLFYTDGITVKNKNHVTMANGTALQGNFTSTQSALIVKQPGNANIYYVFTMGASGTGNLYYTRVDMSLNAGLGGVTIKNTFVIGPTDERLTAVPHSNGTDIWIIITQNYSDIFRAYLLKANGLNLVPTVTTTGLVHTGGKNFLGYLKASAAGNKLAVALHDSTGFELYDFDNATGVVSNPVQMYDTAYNECYGVEFSEDGTRLYGSMYHGSRLYQFDLTAGAPADIINSATLVANSSVSILGALKMAPDHKIYLARYNSKYLGVINNPNELGAACNYVDSGFYMPYGKSQIGLPNAIATYFPVAQQPPVAAFQASDTAVCENNCIAFSDKSTHATSWLWNFPGAYPSSSTDRNPSQVCYFSHGSYDATLIVSNGSDMDTLNLTGYINVRPAPPTPVITSVGAVLYCGTDPSYVSYQWYDDTTQIVGATDTLFVISHGGNYNVRVINSAGCRTAVGINVILGMQDDINGDGITLYPNPAGDRLTVSGLGSTVSGVEIYDVVGSVLYEAEKGTDNRSPEIMLDVSKLSTGIYFLRIKGEGGRVVKRFLKE